MNKHIKWLDFAKGLAIFLVVVGHVTESLYSGNFINNWVHVVIYSFHMPFFFMLSGTTFSDEKYQSFIKFARKKCCTLIIPSYVFIAITTLIYCLMGTLDINLGDMKDKMSLVRTLLQFRVGSISNYWFLPTLYFAFLIMWFVHKIFKDEKCRIIVAIIISTIGAIYVSAIAKPLPFSVDNSLLVYIFMELGYQWKNKTDEVRNMNKLTSIIIALVWVISTYINYQFFGQESISLAYVTLLNPILFFISSLSACILLMKICIRIGQFPRINSWGKNTLVIYWLNVFFVNLISLWLNNYSINNQCISFVICFIVSVIVIEITNTISIMINKYCPFLIGIKKKI